MKPEDVDWNEQYQGDQLWSGQVNATLAIEVEGLPPGTAFDIGCGEGADAIWLAERGWDVTAIDIAQTAIERARAEAGHRGLKVTWAAGNILDSSARPGPFDLVTLHYPAFDIQRLDGVVETLTEATAPGGVALVVGHARPDDPTIISFDHADWVQPDNIAVAVASGSDWFIEIHETRDRVGDHHHDSPHQKDVVLKMRRQ